MDPKIEIVTVPYYYDERENKYKDYWITQMPFYVPDIIIYVITKRR